VTAPRALLRALLVLLALLVAAACGAAPDPAPTPVVLSSSVTGAPGDGPAGRTSASADGTAGGGPEEAAVREVFHRYYALLLDRDFAGACALNAPETTAMLLDGARAGGLPAGTCEEALRAVYAAPATAASADATARTAEVLEVAVTGDAATVTWVGELSGERRTIVSGMRRIDGGWKVADARQ
jgi:ketosteroid isomerase-like protein